MAEATQEMIALANSIREEFWPDFDNAVLAAIQATTERTAALNARQSGDDEEEKAYRIGKDEGYQDAVQEIDIATGGDGEFRFCLGGASERHCPDAETMKARILDRFAARQSGEGERGQ